MAAIWTCDIEVADVARKLANVTGTRTDGDDVRAYIMNGVSVDTHDKPLQQIKTEVVAALYGMYTTEVATAATVVEMIAGWGAALADGLNEMEV